MKFVFKASDGTFDNFPYTPEGAALAIYEFEQKRSIMQKTKAVGRIRPSCSVHRCPHEEGLSCKGQEIERFEI